MTLIAAFPATTGFAICSDSQETVNEYSPELGSYEVRKTVQKIAPIKCGKYEIAICGGGHGDLIESFVIRAKRALEAEDAAVCTMESPASVTKVHTRLEQELERFYANDVAACPDDEKNFKLFVAGCCPIAKEYAVWISENIVLRPAAPDEPELNGWRHNLYVETANRLFRQDMTMGQAALAAIYTVAIAKDTSNYVKDPLAVAVVDKDGIHMVDAPYIRVMEERLSEYEASVNRLFLACADTTVSLPDLELQIQQFMSAVLNLHREQIDQQAENTTLDDLLSRKGLKSLPSVPMLINGQSRLRVLHDAESIRARQERMRAMLAQIGNWPHLLMCLQCGKESEYQIVGPTGPNIREFIACPHCGIANRTAGKVTRFRKIADINWTEATPSASQTSA